MSRAREHLRSNIVGYVALFLALAGGAYALPGRNTVDSGDIRNGQVKTADIRNSNVRGADIGVGAVGSSDVADNALTGTDIAPDALTGADVAADALTGGDIDESTLLGLDATTLSGREVCDFTGQIVINNSSNAQDDAVACTLGPFPITIVCEADIGGTSAYGEVDVDPTLADTAVATSDSGAEVDPGNDRGLVSVQDTTEDDTAEVSLIGPFTAWTLGGSQVAGQAAVRANSLTNDTRVCDFAIFATG